MCDSQVNGSASSADVKAHRAPCHVNPCTTCTFSVTYSGSSHPSPLPWGEGESSAACPQTQHLRNARETECEAPSPQGRGLGAIGLLYRVETSFAPPNNVPNLSGIGRPRRLRT